MQDANDIVDDILAGVPVSTDVEVNLPSENRIYRLLDESKPITIRPMTFEDEKSLINGGDDEDSVNLLLSRCVSNINVNDLITIDKFYLLMKLREISYGDDYNVLLMCSHCGAENPTNVKLSELNVNPVPDDFQEPIKYTLPVLKKEVVLRYPRVKDEKFLEGTGSLDNIWRFVESIDGQTNKTVISRVIEKLPLIDIKTMLKLIKTDFGVDTSVKLKCSECGEISIKELPINANFFDVSL